MRGTRVRTRNLAACGGVASTVYYSREHTIKYDCHVLLYMTASLYTTHLQLLDHNLLLLHSSFLSSPPLLCPPTPTTPRSCTQHMPRHVNKGSSMLVLIRSTRLARPAQKAALKLERTKTLARPAQQACSQTPPGEPSVPTVQ